MISTKELIEMAKKAKASASRMRAQRIKSHEEHLVWVTKSKAMEAKLKAALGVPLEDTSV